MNKFFFDHPELPFISDKDLSEVPIVRKYRALFKHLDLSSIPTHNEGVGCSGYSNHSIIKALVFKALEKISSVPELIWRLSNQPYLSKYILGFKSGIPDESKFYRFLNSFPYSKIDALIASVNTKTLTDLQKKIKTTSIDSKPIKANTKENNPKNFQHNLSDKNKKPKRNKQATLGHFATTSDINGIKRKLFFWGYRIHVIWGGDQHIQLPLVAKLYPNNVSDETVAPSLFRKLKRNYHIKKTDRIRVLGDKKYDCWTVYETVHQVFDGKAIIPTNKRNSKNTSLAVPTCKAALSMKYHSTWYEAKGHRQRFKFVCPQNPKECPFRKNNYGCTKYLQIKDTIPGKVYAHEELFKKLYPKRFGIEQYNATLQHLGQETPNHFKRRSIENTVLFAILGTALIAAYHAKQASKQGP
jgi:hypothetical protein